LQDTKQGPQD